MSNVTNTRLRLLEDAIDCSVTIECEQDAATNSRGEMEYEFTSSGSLWVKCWVRVDPEHVVKNYKNKLKEKKQNKS